MKYPIIIPINTNATIARRGLLSSKATCKAIFAGSDSFKYFVFIIEVKTIKTKSNPYKKQGKNESEFKLTNTVRYGINDNRNNATPIIQTTLEFTLLTMLKR